MIVMMMGLIPEKGLLFYLRITHRFVGHSKATHTHKRDLARLQALSTIRDRPSVP